LSVAREGGTYVIAIIEAFTTLIEALIEALIEKGARTLEP
jgi:hypothetical protein